MDIQFEDCHSIDEFFKSPNKTARKRIKVADLDKFSTVADNLLVHRATKDLWRIHSDGTVERLFEGDAPLDV